MEPDSEHTSPWTSATGETSTEVDMNGVVDKITMETKELFSKWKELFR